MTYAIPNKSEQPTIGRALRIALLITVPLQALTVILFLGYVVGVVARFWR